ncbi:MAG: hypothetical protein O7F69_03400 [Alphaproteobacteria bacterium]|nr:hypothetical protein [Alphaproteobacteria bacterium]MCZ6844923.1 hypothetical protein [Alphaproteobacteria bacterium]
MGDPHPWFRPLYRRVLTTLACVAYIAFEFFFTGIGFFFYLGLVAFAYALWEFFLSGRYPSR